jgi:hypothetical protein
MAINQSTKLEKENLEVHVDMCAMRYEQLDARLGKVEERIDDVADLIQKSQASTSKLLISSTATIIAGVVSVIIAIVLKGGL